MTEEEWLVSNDLLALFEVVCFGSSDRKLRLFASACVQVLERYLWRAESKSAVDVIEWYAEGMASEDDLQQACNGAWAALRDIQDDASEQRWYYVSESAASAVALASEPDLTGAIANIALLCHTALMTASDYRDETVASTETARQTNLIRDILGNPFRPVEVDPNWLTSTVLALAKEMYESRDFSPMPILADALQDAGCDNDDILTHCRGPGPHVRGCWVVDLVLGKS